MPSVTILAPLNGDVVPPDISVYVEYDLATFTTADYRLVCTVGAASDQSNISSSAGTSGTRTFNFSGINSGPVDITATLFAMSDLDDPLATDAERVTVDADPVIRIERGFPPSAVKLAADDDEGSAILGRYRTDVGADKNKLLGAVQKIVAVHETPEGKPTKVKSKRPTVVQPIPVTAAFGRWLALLPAEVLKKRYVFRVILPDLLGAELGKTSGKLDIFA